MVLLREVQVENAIRRHLKQKFGEKNVRKRVSAHGTDICYINRNGEICRVEVEGNANEAGEPLKSASARYTHFYRCLGQICVGIGRNIDSTIFELGLPVDSVYKRYVEYASKALKILEVKRIYWVDRTRGRIGVREHLI